jgi:tetratricopeptide (TPR) repeat protein
LSLTLSAPSLARADTPPEPTAQQQQDAKTIYEHALSLYALGRYAEAAPLFEKAFELKPVPALLYNAAQAHRLAGHAEQAVTLYESYLRMYGDPSRRPEIEAHIAELKSAIEAQKHAATSPPTGAETSAVPPGGATATTPATPSATPSSETLTAAAPARPKPIYKKPWFWAAVGGGVLVVTGVIVGIAVGTRGHTSPPASFGTVNGN